MRWRPIQQAAHRPARRSEQLEGMTTQPGRRQYSRQALRTAAPQCPFALPERFVGIGRREQQQRLASLLVAGAEQPPGRAERASRLQGPAIHAVAGARRAQRWPAGMPWRRWGALERPRQDQRHRPRRMQQRLQHALQAPRGQPGTTFSEGAQVGHFEQRLGRQHQGLAGHLGQVVLDQRQLRAATQRLAAPSHALQAALAITQQADGAALEKVHAPGMDQQQPRRQLEHARLAFAAPAIQLHVQRSQDLPRRLRFRPTLGGTGVVGEQCVEMAFDGLHHVGATASPEQRQEKRRSPSGARREPFGANPRGLPRQVAPGAQGETERWLGKRLECHRTPFPARNFSCSCRLYADQFRKNYRNILQSVVLPGSRQTAPHPSGRPPIMAALCRSTRCLRRLLNGLQPNRSDSPPGYLSGHAGQQLWRLDLRHPVPGDLL
ncbi:hypothetical protein CSC45_0783 [Pseudomonas aeruginosa]|nr:hypothetical protein CSC45_0783 [Pseudomonas aeruginosa]